MLSDLSAWPMIVCESSAQLHLAMKLGLTPLTVKQMLLNE